MTSTMTMGFTLFERMLVLDSTEAVYALAESSYDLYRALTPESIVEAACATTENPISTPCFNMLRDWKFCELWAQRAILSFRRSDTESQIKAVEWIISLMRNCKSLGDLHHATAFLSALTNPAINRLPAAHAAFTQMTMKENLQPTITMLKDENEHQTYVKRRSKDRIYTTPNLRSLVDVLRADAPPSSSAMDRVAILELHHIELDLFMSFHQTSFDTCLKKPFIKKLMQARQGSDLMAEQVKQFLGEAGEIGIQTYAQPGVINSLSHRLLPWVEMFPVNGNRKSTLRSRHMMRLQSSLKLIIRQGKRSSLSSNRQGNQTSLLQSSNVVVSNTVDTPMQAMLQCFWGNPPATIAIKRERMLQIIEDLVMEASQRPSNFLAGEWEAILMECLTCLTENDEKPFRFLVIIESTLLLWHFENRRNGMGDRLESTLKEIGTAFGKGPEGRELSRVILFSLCSRVSHHFQAFRQDSSRPQWANLTQLMRIVVENVFDEEGQMEFGSNDAGEIVCLDEAILLVCAEILAKVSAQTDSQNEVNLSDMTGSNTNEDPNFKRYLGMLISVQQLMENTLQGLTMIKLMKSPRDSDITTSTKPLQRLLESVHLSYGTPQRKSSVTVTSRFKILNPFKTASAAAPATLSASPSGVTGARRKSVSKKTNNAANGEEKTFIEIIGGMARRTMDDAVTRIRLARSGSPRKIASSEIRRSTFNTIGPRRRSMSHDDAIMSGVAPNLSSSGQESELTEEHHLRRQSSVPSLVLEPDVLLHNVDDEFEDAMMGAHVLGAEQQHFSSTATALGSLDLSIKQDMAAGHETEKFDQTNSISSDSLGSSEAYKESHGQISVPKNQSVVH